MHHISQMLIVPLWLHSVSFASTHAAIYHILFVLSGARVRSISEFMATMAIKGYKD